MDAIGPETDLFTLPGVAFAWNDENIEQLKVLIANKLSAAEIAAELRTGRNSVLGKIHRLGLSMPSRPGSAHTRTKPSPRALHWTGFPKRKSPDRKPPMIVDNHQSPKVECVPLNIRFLDTTSEQCKYIIGDVNGAETVCCGLPSEEGKPYCIHHDLLCHTRRGGWERPDYSRNMRKYYSTTKQILGRIDDPSTPEQLPDVA